MSSSTSRQDSSWCMVKPKMIFGLSQVISFTVITWNPESEESIPIPLKFVDVTRTTDTTLDVMSKKKLKITGTLMEIENWFHKVHHIE